MRPPFAHIPVFRTKDNQNERRNGYTERFNKRTTLDFREKGLPRSMCEQGYQSRARTHSVLPPIAPTQCNGLERIIQNLVHTVSSSHGPYQIGAEEPWASCVPLVGCDCA